MISQSSFGVLIVKIWNENNWNIFKVLLKSERKMSSAETNEKS